MRRFIGSGRLSRVLPPVLGLLALWKLLSLFYSPLVVPRIGDVFGELWAILSTPRLFGEVLRTLWRLLAGLALGVAAGVVLGFFLGRFRRLHDFCRPVLGLMQSVPPISWLILALIWFGFNGRPSVFIVAVAALPVMVVNIVEGIRSIDPKLVQMGTVYGFSRGKRLRYIAFPSIRPYFRAGLRVVAGSGCKIVVMGEALTTDSGIGGAIATARLNLAPEGVVAWTILIVLLYYLLDAGVSLLLPEKKTC